MASIFDSLVSAIDQQVRVTFDYGGRRRIVEPWVVGIGPDGQPQLAAEQVAGDSETASAGVPKLFKLEGMSRLELLNEARFEVPSFYRRGDSRFVTIACQL